MRPFNFGIIVALTGALMFACASLSAAADKNIVAGQSAGSGTDTSGKGKDAAAKPEAGAPSSPQVSEQTFGAWTLQCLIGRKARPACQITHRLVSSDGKQIALVVSMAMTGKDTVALQMALPLGFAIQDGVKIAFGSNYSTVAKVTRCTSQGCLVEGNCPPGMLAAMVQSKNGVVSVRTIEGREAEFPVSLDGFSDAYNAMKSKVS